MLALDLLKLFTLLINFENPKRKQPDEENKIKNPRLLSFNCLTVLIDWTIGKVSLSFTTFVSKQK